MKKVQESAQPISTESILEVPTDNASTSPFIQQEDVAKMQMILLSALPVLQLS